jgi:glycosyltransferase involved in cell wall biosynthesis
MPNKDDEKVSCDASWRLLSPMRRLIGHDRPSKRRFLPSLTDLIWWGATLQLGTRLRQRRRFAKALGQSTPQALTLEAAWYLAQNPDVATAGIDPLRHYRKRGIAEGRNWGLPTETNLSQQAARYLLQNPDVAAAGVDPLQHFLQHGSKEGRAWPRVEPTVASSADREAAWYLTQNPDVAASGVDPSRHYHQIGMAEGRSWGLPAEAELRQQADWYLLQNPDVAVAGLDPLKHFLKHGSKEGRAWPRMEPTADELAADGLPWVRLLNILVDAEFTNLSALNVLIPTLSVRGMSGGPNTAVNLACRLAATGIRVRLISTQAPLDADSSGFWDHATKLAGVDPRNYGVELIDASYRGIPLRIGANDLFMATAWWTAQAVKYAVRHTRQKRFLYLIQDYESLLHPASTQMALADETYHLDHLPIVNSRLLYDFLVEHGIGRFGDSQFAAEALVFEPAVDTTLFFHCRSGTATILGRKRLLFYARPTSGLRNLFELGVAALRKLVNEGTISPDGWDIYGIGESFDPILLGRDCWLRPLPWKDLSTYAQLMRESDALISLMLSPHPSYPPLEMAACGRPVVTSTFGTKDAARLATISPNIIGVEPTLDAIADGVALAIRRGGEAGTIGLPTSWSESLETIVSRLHKATLQLQGFDFWPGDAYGLYRQRMLHDRAPYYMNADPALLSFITPVWNTPPHFLDELAATVFGQDSGPGFEWVILDNGSDQAETRTALARIAENPAVRLFRMEENCGIVRGLRYLLERAHHRYILPLDHDDLLTPDCVRVMTSALRNAGFPLLAYSDEDKTFEGQPRDPYCKPDFDPVLFTHSCYTSHLCAIDREAALRFSCYTNREVEGSSDWDSFTRFFLAGHLPLHVPEVLYTWRMHPQSTAMDMTSKSYIHESQRSVLRLFLSGRGVEDRYTVELSPLFDGTPDWRFVRNACAPRPITTILFGPDAEANALTPTFEGHRIERLETPDLVALLAHARRAALEGKYLHLLSSAVAIDDNSWASEALAMFELYPGTAMVGGRVHDNGIVVAADSYFGFDGGCGSPNIGRKLSDAGYFCQMLKSHAASAVPLQHCVIDSTFLVDALSELIRAGAGLDYLSAWLGAAARIRNLRCIYSPFLSAAALRDIEPPPAIEISAFVIAHAMLIPDHQLLSPRLGLTRKNAYRPMLRAERAAEEYATHIPPSLAYPEQHAADLLARRLVAAPLRSESADLSVLTSVYIRTDPELFHATAATMFAQTLSFKEWLILAHGPLDPALEQMLIELERDRRVRILRRATNVGIINGLRICLEEAHGRFVAPLDADDLLTADALQLLIEALTKNGGADFAFSDEDILCEGELRSPFRRTPFDAILCDADSTIWHFCGFKRDRALQLGVYSDVGAEACHDWDTVQRFEVAGASMRHVPHVLYHWRHHTASTSNSGTVNEASLRSVRHVLSGIISRQSNPDLYEIKHYPLFRGVEQFALLRRHVAPLSLCLIYLVRNDRLTTVPDEVLASMPIRESRILTVDPRSGSFGRAGLKETLENISSEHLVILDEKLRPSNDEGPWDAMRLFEMHGDVAAVGGRIMDAEGRVVACCETLARCEAATEWVGRSRGDPGGFALALKPQAAMRIAEGYFCCRTELFRTIATVGEVYMVEQMAGLIGEAARTRGMKLAYSPLMEASYSPEIAANLNFVTNDTRLSAA